MSLQERIEVVEPSELRSDQATFLSVVCKKFILDCLGSKISEQECIDSSEAERIVAMELPSYLQALCESSKSPKKMLYPVLDAMRLIEEKRLHVVSIFEKAYCEAEIGMMRDDVVEQVDSARCF